MVAVLEIGAFGMSFARSRWFVCAHAPCPPVTSLAAGRIGDSLGRRGTLFVGAVVFALGGAIQTLTSGFWVMVFGRIIAGFGVGLLSYVGYPTAAANLLTRCTGPSFPSIKAKSHHPITYVLRSTALALAKQCNFSAARSRAWNSQSISSAMHRPLYVFCWLTCAHSWLTKAQWIDYFCSFFESDMSWRIPLSVQCIIGALLAAGSLTMPESPR